ncbi:MAG: nucleoside hydrolase [Clostridia bacterium]|nr:nucleoside hydrolase [Clostridia bacterium]
MEKLKLIIDTDIGDEIDDALALYYAMRREYDIIGITCVYKNTEERARITKRLLSLYGKGYESVPVFAGHGTPIAEERAEYPHTCHYHDGLNAPEYAPDGYEDAAVDFIIDACEKYGKELAVVAIGPFTNIARVIEKSPTALDKAARVVIMGGAYYRQYTDWNVMCDVEAADVMFSSLPNLECVGADVTHRLPLTREQHEVTLNCKNDGAAAEIGELIRLWSIVNPDRYPTLHDPLAVEYAIDPEICETERARVKVISDGFARGLTLNVDGYNKDYMNPVYSDNKINEVVVAKDIDAKAFTEKFLEVFR